MGEEKKPEKKANAFLENLAELTTPEGIQKYFLGTKKNGAPRAAYDIFKDYIKPKKKKHKKNKKKKNESNSYSFYLNTKKGKKKKDKKHWHI